MMTILTQTVARLLLLPVLVIAAALLIKGYTGVGDGFSAGVTAALGVLLQYVAFGRERVAWLVPVRVARAAVFVGLLLVLLVAFLPVLWGKPLLSHFPAPGAHVVHLGRLELHTALVFDLGVGLLVFGFAITTISIIARHPEATGEEA